MRIPLLRGAGTEYSFAFHWLVAQPFRILFNTDLIFSTLLSMFAALLLYAAIAAIFRVKGKLDEQFVSSVIAVSTVFSVVTIPFWLYVVL